MDNALDPKPARIGPIAEGRLFYRPVRRMTQVVVLTLMGLWVAMEWAALLLRLE